MVERLASGPRRAPPGWARRLRSGTSYTSSAVRIADVTVLRGLNVYAPVPVIRLRLETDGPTAPAGPAFAEELLRRVPNLNGHDGLFDRLRRDGDVPLTGVVARVATGLQVLGGGDLPYTAVADVDAGATVVYAYDDPTVGVIAGELAVRIVDALLAGEPADLSGDVAAFLEEVEERHLSSTDAAIVRGARERGIPVMRIRNRLVQLGQGRFQQRLWGSHTTRTLHLGSKIAANKQYSHRLLQALGLPLARQEWADTPDKAVAAAERIGYPVVVKPNRGSMGQGVTVGLTDAAEVRAAFDLAAPSGVPIVQNYVPGADHRMLVIDGELIGVVKRVPAQVVGDGVSSIEALVEVANRDPRRGPGHRRALTFLTIDERAERMLARRGLDRHSVPAAGEVVELCDVANVSLGGMPVDVTDDVHPDNQTMAVRAALAVGLDIAGIDFLTTDISSSYLDAGGAICEINDKPDLRLHLFPAGGEPRDVVGPILDMLFPPGAQAGIPVAAITGETGKSATSHLLAAMLQAAGHSVGLAGADGVQLNGRTVREGPLSPPTSVRTVLLDPTVDAAVLEASPRRIRNRGLGLDACEVAAALNVPTDGDADTIRAVELVLDAATRLAVLNADDHDCLALATAARATRVCLVATDADNPKVAEHVAAGGCVVIQHLEEGPITLLDGGCIVAQFAVAPTRWAGFAVALAHGLGLDVRHIDAALHLGDGGAGSAGMASGTSLAD
jgi:cyanophycin synthetase